MTIHLPVLVAEGLDLFCFDSVAEAEASLEVTDVEAGIFSLFDATGVSLQAVTEGGTVRVLETSEQRRDALEDLLLRYLDAIGVSPLDNRELSGLVGLCRGLNYRWKR